MVLSLLDCAVLSQAWPSVHPCGPSDWATVRCFQLLDLTFKDLKIGVPEIQKSNRGVRSEFCDRADYGGHTVQTLVCLGRMCESTQGPRLFPEASVHTEERAFGSLGM